MTEPVNDPFPVDHSALQQPPESFRVNLEIDGKSSLMILTAFNGKSMVALLQFVMIMNRKRIAGYTVETVGVLVGDQGRLVAAVPFKDYYQQVIAHTSLKNEAPKEPAKPELSYWDSFRVGERTMNPNTKKFTLEIVIDGVVDKFPVEGANEDSMIALFTAVTCAQIPRISGWNLYTEEGALLVSFPAMIFLALLAEKTSLGKPPADPKAAGWRAIPAVAPTSEEWQKTVEAAKKAGRTPT